MTPAQLDALEAAARKRLAEYINRMAVQHLRRLRENWRAAV